MNSKELRKLQAPLKAAYAKDANEAFVTFTAEGKIGEGVTCKLETGKKLIEAGLHPKSGGSGLSACSGDMLLEALVACAGVTMAAVATALQIDIKDGRVRAEGDLDFRGTLGVEKDVPVGFQNIRLIFELETDASKDMLATLLELTERYCVVYQTLAKSPAIESSMRVNT